MKILVTGSAGHLGEALMRTLRAQSHAPVGIDILSSPFTDKVISITDRSSVKECMKDVEVVLHTATLHKPHVSTHTRQEFIETNITGTLNLLEEAVEAKVKSFVFTSTTSVFGRAFRPPLDQPAVWVDELLKPIPRNIYGVTKHAAEELCELFHYKFNLPCLVLRTSRFFPEEDDSKEMRGLYEDGNIKANEYLYRRVEIEDVVNAHLLAMEKAPEIGFDRYIISATTPFRKGDLVELRKNAPQVVRRLAPEYEREYDRLNWKMFPSIERVYDNEKARKDLGWSPRYDFSYIISLLKEKKEIQSPLATTIGTKGYHEEEFAQGPFPVDE